MKRILTIFIAAAMIVSSASTMTGCSIRRSSPEDTYSSPLRGNETTDTPLDAEVVEENYSTEHLDASKSESKKDEKKESETKSKAAVMVESKSEKKTESKAESKAEKKSESKSEEKAESKEGAKYLIRERRYSKFSRSFSLPDDVDSEKLAANVKNGILTINMPKKAITAPKQITITCA